MSGFRATRRLVPMAAAMLAAGVVALATRSWIPAVALVPLTGLLLGSFAEVLLPLPRAAARRVPGPLVSGDEVTVHVDVERRVLPYNVTVSDDLPEGLAAVPGQHTRLQAHGRRSTTRYGLQARRRGEHRLATLRVGRVSALGLFARWSDLPVHTAVRVLPPTARRRRVRVRARTRGHTGVATRRARRGPGDEFYALRAYQPGDPLGDVNWKATARMGRVITNEFLPEEPPQVLLYLDTRGFGREDAEQADVFERTLEAGAVLADALLRERAHVGLVLLSYWSSYIAPARGGRHAQRMQRLLLDCGPGDDAPIEALVKAGAPHLPRHADAVLVTSDAYDATLGGAVSFLRRRHGRVVVLAPAFPEPEEEEAVARRASGALLNTELESALEDLRGLAHRAVLWRDAEPLDVVLARLGMQGRAR